MNSKKKLILDKKIVMNAQIRDEFVTREPESHEFVTVSRIRDEVGALYIYSPSQPL